MSKQFFAPVGLRPLMDSGLTHFECVKLVSCKPGASRELVLRPPRPEKLHNMSIICPKLVFGYATVVIGTNLISLVFE